MTKNTLWTDNFLLGKVDGENIYISAPSWDCGWYWGFGYLGNKNLHYHLSGLSEKHKKNLFDAIKDEFGDTLTIKDDQKLWLFCELMQTAYTLKETAEVLGRGGSHYTSNLHAELIKNPEEVKRINEKVLPAIFDTIAHSVFNQKI